MIASHLDKLKIGNTLPFFNLSYNKKTVVLITSSIIFSNSVLASEDSEDSDIERIVVVEHKQPYRGNVPMKEQPQAVTILSDELLDSLGVVNFQSAIALAGSTAKQNNFGGLWESFAIRGFAGDENLPSAYLINGFSAGRGYSGVRDTSNIEAIEIVKGPGSALYGRSEPGGTVNIITKKPQFSQEGYLSYTIGGEAFNRLELDYTNGVSEQVAFRINGAYEDAESHRDTVETKKLALTPSIYAEFSANTSVLYELELLDQEIPFDRGIPVINGVELPASRFLGEPNDGPMKVKATGHQLTLNHQLNENWRISTGFGYRDSSLEGYSSDTELSPGRQLLYTDGETLNRQRRHRDYDAKDASARFELSGSIKTGEIEHNLLIGADTYDYELHTVQQRFRVGWGSGDTTYAINVFNPVYGQAQPDVSPLTDRLEEQQAWGLYIQDQIDLSDKLKISTGVRFDSFEQDITNNFTGTTSSVSKDEVNPRLGITYNLLEEVMFYTSYSEGFRPNSGADFDGNNFEPEKSESIEAGIKWVSADNNMSASIALFNTEKSNILTSDLVNPGFTAALGKAESTGLELDFALNLTKYTNLSGNYSYVDARTASDLVNLDWGVNIDKGSQLINIPEHAFNLFVTHMLEIGGSEAELGLHIQHIGERLGETINPDYQLDAYTLFNLFGSLQMTENLALHVSLENLTDEDYIANSYSELWSMPGRPTHYKARIKYSF